MKNFNSYKIYSLLIVILLITIVLSIGIGSVVIYPQDIFLSLITLIPIFDYQSDISESLIVIINQIRLPRIILAGIVGFSIALSGATFQSIFKNPLADPYLIGAASGSALGATIVLMIIGPVILIQISILPLASFLGGIVAVGITVMISFYSRSMSSNTLILSGIAVGALANALTSLIIISSNPDVRPLLSWLLGSFNTANWDKVLIIIPYVLISTILLFRYRRIMNIIQSSDSEAQLVGVEVNKTKYILIVISTLLTAIAVSVSGIIGFVGLVAPHAVRLLWGYDYKYLIPCSALLGSIILILADTIGRTILYPQELPVGVITAFIGAPFFIFLIIKGRSSFYG
ncbi:MAG: FecCD family ABC transporter permease [Dehalococcoidia bacterium]|tara:strand:+ start:185 stop:1219 length:1035 start_codon:yes stop_codon:yes gene_type:complete